MSTALELESDPLGCIVVATDFSETANLALDRGLELARRHESEIVLVHAMQADVPPLAAPEMVVVPANYEEVLREASLEGLAHAAERVRAAGIPVSEHLGAGRPAAVITERAEELQADLILVGSRGNTGFKHLLLGSIAEEVVRTATCPVLTIHPTDTRSIEPVKTLLFPTDFSEVANQAISAATRLLVGSDEIRVLVVHTFHIAPMVMPLRGFGRGKSLSFVDNAKQLAETATEPTARALRELGFEVEVIVERGDPAEIVTELARDRGVDVIAMGTRGHSKIRQLLLGSTTERVVEHAPCPVFTVHRTSE